MHHEITSTIFARSVQICDGVLALDEIELGTARWRRPSKMSRVEVVRPPPTDVVVQTCPWRVGAQEQIVGKILCIFQRGLGTIVDCESWNARKLQFRSG